MLLGAAIIDIGQCATGRHCRNLPHGNASLDCKVCSGSTLVGEPDFGLIGLPHAANLPAVRWKVQNLQKLKRDNLDKHMERRIALEAVWTV